MGHKRQRRMHLSTSLTHEVGGQSKGSKTSASRYSFQWCFLPLNTHQFEFSGPNFLFSFRLHLCPWSQFPTLSQSFGCWTVPRESAQSTRTGVVTLRGASNDPSLPHKLKIEWCCFAVEGKQKGEVNKDEGWRIKARSEFPANFSLHFQRTMTSLFWRSSGCPYAAEILPLWGSYTGRHHVTRSQCGWDWVIPQLRLFTLSTGLWLFWTCQHFVDSTFLCIKKILEYLSPSNPAVSVSIIPANFPFFWSSLLSTFWMNL